MSEMHIYEFTLQKGNGPILTTNCTGLNIPYAIEKLKYRFEHSGANMIEGTGLSIYDIIKIERLTSCNDEGKEVK